MQSRIYPPLRNVLSHRVQCVHHSGAVRGNLLSHYRQSSATRCGTNRQARVDAMVGGEDLSLSDLIFCPHPFSYGMRQLC